MKRLSISYYIDNIDNNLKKEFWSLFEPLNYKKGDFFMKYGESIKILGCINKGISRSFIMNPNNEEITMGFSIENDFITGGFNPGEPSNFYIEVIKDSTILVADYYKIQDIRNKYIQIRKIFNAMADFYISKKQNRMSKMNFTSAAERYEYFLKDYPGLINRIPHYYIANYLGITPTQLSRVRKSIITKNK